MTGPVALFPGQLSEKAGMGEALAAAHPYVADLFKEFSALSGVDLGAVFFGEGSARLHDDLPAQVGVYAVSVAVLEVLRREHGVVPAACAGYSLGTYAAYVGAGVVDARAGLSLVLETARLLGASRATGGMAFSIGLSRDEVSALVAQLSADPLELSIATENAPRQLVVTGSPGAVRAFVERAGPVALKAGVLPIGHPMHSGRLAGLGEALGRFVRGNVPLSPPSAALFVPMTGERVTTVEEAFDVLALQIARPSRWEAAVRAAAAEFPHAPLVEVGPGDVLARMCRWILRRPATVLEDPDTIGAFAAPAAVAGGRGGGT